MDLEGRGLVLQEGLPIFFFPLMDHCHSREDQGRWNLVASCICLYLQGFVSGRKKSDRSPDWGRHRIRWLLENRVFSHHLVVFVSKFLKCRDFIVSKMQLGIGSRDRDLLFLLRVARQL